MHGTCRHAGDRHAGVLTLPVLLGPPAALLLATGVLLAGAGVALAASTPATALATGILHTLTWRYQVGGVVAVLGVLWSFAQVISATLYTCEYT